MSGKLPNLHRLLNNRAIIFIGVQIALGYVSYLEVMAFVLLSNGVERERCRMIDNRWRDNHRAWFSIGRKISNSCRYNLLTRVASCACYPILVIIFLCCTWTLESSEFLKSIHLMVLKLDRSKLLRIAWKMCSNDR